MPAFMSVIKDFIDIGQVGFVSKGELSYPCSRRDAAMFN